MGLGAKKVKAPADPDPTPTVTDTGNVEKAAERAEKKRIGQNYSRSKTILAGNSGNEAQKKTILGG